MRTPTTPATGSPAAGEYLGRPGPGVRSEEDSAHDTVGCPPVGKECSNDAQSTDQCEKREAEYGPINADAPGRVDRPHGADW